MTYQSPTVQRLLSLLRSSIFHRPVPSAQFDSMSDNDWLEINYLGTAQRMNAIVFDGMENSNVRPDSPIYEDWKGSAQQVEYISRKRQDVAQDLAAQWSGNGRKFFFIGEYALAKCYPNPMQKQCRVIDCAVDGEEGSIDNGGITCKCHNFSSAAGVDAEIRGFLDAAASSSVGDKRIDTQYAMALSLFQMKSAMSLFLRGKLTLSDICDWTMLKHRHVYDIDAIALEDHTKQYGMNRFVHSMNHIADYISLDSDHLLNADDQLMLNDILGCARMSRWRRFRTFTDWSWGRCAWRCLTGYRIK